MKDSFLESQMSGWAIQCNGWHLWLKVTIEWKLWRGVMHMGELSFSISSCIPSKYMNQGKLSESFFHQKSLPYRPNHFSLTIHSGSHRFGPWVIKTIPGLLNFQWFFCWKYEHTFWLSHLLANVLFSSLQKDTLRS